MSGPYCSVTELLQAPTGIDWSSVPMRNATLQAQRAEALRVIRRATSWVNGQTGQTLWATRDVEVLNIPSRYVQPTANGYVIFPAAFPILSVESVALADDAATWSPLSGNAVFQTGPGRLPQSLQYLLNVPQSQTGSLGGGNFLQLTYLNGFPNAHTTAASLVGATSLPVDDPTGFQPGDSVTIYDGDDQEDVTLSSTYVVGTSPLQLFTPTLYAHATGTTVSEMAEAIREAVILYSTDLVRQRGKDAVALLPTGGARLIQGTVSSKIDAAKELLDPYVRRL